MPPGIDQSVPLVLGQPGKAEWFGGAGLHSPFTEEGIVMARLSAVLSVCLLVGVLGMGLPGCDSAPSGSKAPDKMGDKKGKMDDKMGGKMDDKMSDKMDKMSDKMDDKKGKMDDKMSEKKDKMQEKKDK
jgi:hypothetical protein